MIIGIPKEIKVNENRVSLVPADVETLIQDGHTVLVETKAGLGSGFTDEDYLTSGAKITDQANVYRRCDLLCKVKEIEASEHALLKRGQIVMTYLHSNAHYEMTTFLLDQHITGIAYEDIDDPEGKFPLLSPMSIFAGKGGFLAALQYSQTIYGGPGTILCNITGLAKPHITILGAGYSGVAAAELAAAFGNQVSLLDIDLKALEKARLALPENVEFLASNRKNLLECLAKTDVFINCILWPKTRQDHLVYRKDLGLMKRGSLIVDVSCDEAGAIETSRSTTHDDSIYEIDGIRHYAVDNIPSAFARDASVLLSLSILPYVRQVCNQGVEQALLENQYLRRGLTTYRGKLTLEETARKLNLPYIPPLVAING